MTWMFLNANDDKEAICLTEPGDERQCWPTSEAGGFPCRRWSAASVAADWPVHTGSFSGSQSRASAVAHLPPGVSLSFSTPLHSVRLSKLTG